MLHITYSTKPVQAGNTPHEVSSLIIKHLSISQNFEQYFAFFFLSLTRFSLRFQISNFIIYTFGAMNRLNFFLLYHLLELKRDFIHTSISWSSHSFSRSLFQPFYPEITLSLTHRLLLYIQHSFTHGFLKIMFNFLDHIYTSKFSTLHSNL